MKGLSNIALSVRASATLAVDSLAKQMRSEGLDVIGFGAGEPDVDTPDNIKEAARAAIDAGMTKYTSSAGIIELRRAVAERLRADFGVSYEPGQIVVASGAKHSVYIALMTLLNPGDEVIIPSPYWVTYTEAVRMAYGVPVIVETTRADGFKLDPKSLEAAITAETKLIIINNPSNPTGTLYSVNELRALAKVCARHDLYILADEIYSSLVYGGKKFVSVASLGGDIKERTILINGLSKSYSMTGWRIGYSATNSGIAGVMESYLSHSTFAPSTISQYAALKALTGSQDSREAMRSEFERRRDYAVARIDAIDGISCVKPDGAFYIMINIDKQLGRTLGGRTIRSGDDFALSLLKNELVAMVSGSGFGAPNYIRLTYAASMDEIARGLDRLERFVSGGAAAKAPEA
ncbi:MAG: pyridoxal phosphate-dependent aminotransferase [Oscillospiraceae bacterium]|jgi:aspartate aminotransferase|nr:pyridoxal phosphate-dependent aminotransferase [Oscillospiraceae bacterium]